MGDLSKHFSTAEFACPHCDRCIISGRLISALEQLRALGPEPIIIHDGYRCPEHNKAVGGVFNSEHVQGMAADLNIVGLNLQQQYDRALQIPDFASGGIGVYDTNFIHVDIRDGKARWSRKAGVYAGLDVLVKS